MTDHAFTESVVEQAALGWLEAIGWSVAHGPDIAPDMPAAERANYGEVVLGARLRDPLLLRLLSGDRRARGAEQFTGRTV
ncbi:MAG TPA: hypothetical protein VFE48_05160 [Methylomirabilota bacterium]|nr:hypothetical protein [Methylomirabilota bacterium]